MNIIGIIPARYASTRFPGKPLIDVMGKSMIQRVYEQACKASKINGVYIATDDARILEHVKTFTDKVILTAPYHNNGTERCHEASNLLPQHCDVIINIQGDEPYIQPEQIDQLAEIFIDKPHTEIATLIKETDDLTLIHNSGVVKAVINQKWEAMYFSRSTIPFYRDEQTKRSFFKHIGIYGYRKGILQKIVTLAPSRLEQIESLEQLRWLENGFKIQCALTSFETKSVDTPEDLLYLIGKMKDAD